MQTTGAVFAFVVVMAVSCITDKSLEWVLYDWFWAGRNHEQTLVRRTCLFRF